MSKYKGKNFLDKCGSKIDDKTKIDGAIINFREEDLRGASFEGMTIQGVNFSKAQLQGANFKGAKLINVTFDDAETGITTTSKFFLEVLSYSLAFVAGITAAYSLDYFFLVIDVSFKSGILYNIILPIFFLAMLLTSIIWAIVRGMGTYFVGFLLLNVILSFLFQAFAQDGTAATSIVGLSCFVGGLSSVFVQSQSIYLSKELQSLSETDSGNRIRTYSLDTVAVVGSTMGALSGGNSPIISAVFSVILIVSGHQLGLRAREEKQKLMKATREDFFEYLEGDSEKSLNSEELIERVREERTKRLQTKLYPAVRVLFDSVLSDYKTNFLKATFDDVSIDRTNLEKTHFLPERILFSRRRAKIENTRKDEQDGIEKGGDMLTDPELNRNQNQLENILNGIAESGGSITLLINPTFGGGYAGSGGFQIGGELAQGKDKS